ncbi:MAG TPA: squalene--hopene cyclase, partial [Planctomycetaceae bacterium]|nr:squalene--hopene cyclase [Planctomycetaceae bacterium]
GWSRRGQDSEKRLLEPGSPWGERARRAARYIRQQQLPTGGWAIYPGGPLEISASVKAYFALKLTGHSPDSDDMTRARHAILEAGGAERVNSFTRFYLALLGVISYAKCPAVPPELVLLPPWVPFNIYEMSSWSRTIIVPLSLLWAHRPAIQVPPSQNVRELFVRSPEELPATLEPAPTLDDLSRRTWIDWARFFRGVDLAIKWLDRCRVRPLRRRAIRKAAEWMIDRFEESDGLGAIFPPIIWSIIALKCLGYDDDSPELRSQLRELDKLTLSDGDTDRLQPCLSPVWDTAIALLSLREAGVPPEHPAIRRATDWLVAKEVRRPGDWAVRNRGHEPSGWFFEFNNVFYPDVDDTGMVVMALRRSLPITQWSADFLIDDWSPHDADKDAAAILAGQTASSGEAYWTIELVRPVLGAIRRGARWVLAMQNSDGGWGAFDRDNDREIFTRVPFADHNAMIDPSCCDLIARMLEMFAMVNMPRNHPAIQRAIEFLWARQEHDFCWPGRWGVNYIYGTWQTLVGLTAVGVPPTDRRIRAAAQWLKDKQQPCGGWGETPASYDDPRLRGQGPPTASQTAWALMGLMAAGETDSEAVSRGIDYLLATQLEDGTWDEPWFTGTGFPRVFYLKYHLYRTYFPLMALGRYRRLKRQVTEQGRS